MSFVSYAQNFEDVTLFRALGKLAKGAYVDVGASDPVSDSVTRAFYERGWRGVNIEPIASVHARLVADRPEDVNLNVAVADVTGELTLHEVVGTGMSTLVAEIAQLHRAGGHQVRDITVPVTTLDSVWDEQGLHVVHFLKIDVEGAERQVLQGIDLTKHRPWVILVESTRPNSMEPTHQEWEPLLFDRGYVFVYFDGLNRFYVASEKEAELREPLSLPPNYFDQFVRYSDVKVQQRAHAIALEVESLRAELRRVASSLAKSHWGRRCLVSGRALANHAVAHEPARPTRRAACGRARSGSPRPSRARSCPCRTRWGTLPDDRGRVGTIGRAANRSRCLAFSAGRRRDRRGGTAVLGCGASVRCRALRRRALQKPRRVRGKPFAD